MTYEHIQRWEGEFGVRKQCDVLEVSRSGYYEWRERGESARHSENRALGVAIKEAFEQSEQTYGSPRVHAELKARGLTVGRKRIARIMRKDGLVSVHRKKFRCTTDSNHQHPVAANVLEREFEATGPNQKWAGDITYIQTRAGWLYLAVVLDLFSRQIVGWSFSDSLSKNIAVDALQMALRHRGVSPELFHSDRGVQYASGTYQQELIDRQIICSMSRKGNCWDNAVSESFFHSLKVERVYRRRYACREHARADVFDYIERFYNRRRRHSSLGYLSPVEFEIIKKAA